MCILFSAPAPACHVPAKGNASPLRVQHQRTAKPLSPTASPVLFAYVNRLQVDAVLEPPLGLSNVHIVAAHLPLPHPPVWGKGPVFQPVGAVPLAGFVMPLVPKLHGDL